MLMTGASGEDAGASRFFETNHEAPYTRIAKEVATKPVINVGRFTDPDVMVEVIRSGQADIIGAARPSIADPFLPKKIEEGVQELKRSLLNDPDNSVTWRLLAQAYDTQKKDGEARLATAEQYYSLGAVREAKVFAMRARELLPKNTPDWRRATDIVLASRPSNQDLKDLAKDSVGQN